MLLVYFLTRGDTVTAEGYGSTNLDINPMCLSNLYQSQYCVTQTLQSIVTVVYLNERLRQAICGKRPTLLCQGVSFAK